MSSEVVQELLYVDDFARRALFFRRLRLPSLIHVLWDTVYVTPAMRRFLRFFVRNRDEQLLKGRRALAKLKLMIELAEELRLPAADLHRQCRAFEALAIARDYWLGSEPREALKRLSLKLREPDDGAEPLYEFRLGGHLSPVGFTLLGFCLWCFLRDVGQYRRIDRWITLHALPWLGRGLGAWFRRRLPDMARTQGMGWRHFLR